MFAIIPNVLADVINAKLEVAFAACPEAEKDRDCLYHSLLLFYDEHGYIPEFDLVKKEPIPDDNKAGRDYENRNP